MKFKDSIKDLIKDKKADWIKRTLALDVSDGDKIDYYPNGDIFRKYTFKDKMFEGEFKAYWRNGQLFIHCFYKKGKWDGDFKSWDRDGKLEDHKLYKNGKIVINYLKK